MCHCNESNETVNSRTERPLGISRGFCLNSKLNGVWKHQTMNALPFFLRNVMIYSVCLEYTYNCHWSVPLTYCFIISSLRVKFIWIQWWQLFQVWDGRESSKNKRGSKNKKSTETDKFQRKICGITELFIPTSLLLLACFLLFQLCPWASPSEKVISGFTQSLPWGIW